MCEGMTKEVYHPVQDFAAEQDKRGSHYLETNNYIDPMIGKEFRRKCPEG